MPIATPIAPVPTIPGAVPDTTATTVGPARSLALAVPTGGTDIGGTRAATTVLAARDEAVDAIPTGDAGRAERMQADVIATDSRPDVAHAPFPGTVDPAAGGSLLISIDLPGSSEELGLELRPSRVAAAWLVWLAITFVVIAFWWPASARHLSRLRLRDPARPKR